MAIVGDYKEIGQRYRRLADPWIPAKEEPVWTEPPRSKESVDQAIRSIIERTRQRRRGQVAG